MANRVSEIIEKRNLNSNSYLLDNGAIEVEACSGPVNYKDYADGQFKPIDLSFADDAGGTRGAQHLASNNRMSMGMAKDKKHAKMVGFRLDAAHQFEISQNSIILNGVERLSGTEFASISKLASNRAIELGVDANTSVVHELGWKGVVGYVKTTLALTGFTIKEEFHLKGFSCTNTGVGDEYTPDVNGKFNFKDDTTGEWAFSVKAPLMWDSKAEGAKDKYSSGVAHRLYYIAGPKIMYEKTPTADGLTWLSTAVGAVSIDATVEVNGSTGDGTVFYTSGVAWATTVAGLTGTVGYNTMTTMLVDAEYVDADDSINHRGFLFFTLSLAESDTITAASVRVTVTSRYGTPTWHIFQSTSADPLVAGSYNDFTGSSLGSAAAPASGDSSISLSDVSWLTKSGVNKFCLRTSLDVNITTPTTETGFFCGSQEHTTAASRPLFTVTYTPGAASFTGKVIVIL